MARLHLPPERLDGSRVILEGEPHRYLARALRLGPGADVTIFDGAGVEVAARIVTVGSRSTELALGARRAVALPKTEVLLLQAIAKGERMDLVVQKTTELGVTRIVPVIARRSVARPHDAEHRRERWAAIAAEAARQCGRADVPKIDAPIELTSALTIAPPDAARLALWEGCHDRPLRRALIGNEARVALLVGPEGGFAPEEIDAARAASFLPVGVGPRILRTETAAIVAVALVQAALGGLD